jgi:hypothetical protein
MTETRNIDNEATVQAVSGTSDGKEGYATTVAVGDYVLMLIRGDDQLADVCFTRSDSSDRVKSVADAIQFARKNKNSVIMAVHETKASKTKSGFSTIALVKSRVDAKCDAAYVLLLVDNEKPKIAPRLYACKKEAEAHAGEIMELILNRQVDWRNTPIAPGRLG